MTEIFRASGSRRGRQGRRRRDPSEGPHTAPSAQARVSPLARTWPGRLAHRYTPFAKVQLAVDVVGLALGLLQRLDLNVARRECLRVTRQAETAARRSGTPPRCAPRQRAGAQGPPVCWRYFRSIAPNSTPCREISSVRRSARATSAWERVDCAGDFRCRARASPVAEEDLDCAALHPGYLVEGSATPGDTAPRCHPCGRPYVPWHQ